MSAILLLLQLLSLVLGIGSLVCFVLTLIKMFQNNQTVMGIVCIVTLLLCGIGGLIAFIVGWMNAANWRHQQVMLAWTFIVIAQIVLWVFVMMLAAAAGVQPGLGPMA